MTLRLTGRIVVSGAPTEGAYIRINGPSGDFVWEARTDADGEFGFNLPEGEWTLLAFAPGTQRHAEQFTLTPESDPVFIDLRPA